MPVLIDQLSLSVAQRQAIGRLISNKWRSIFYDRNALIDDIRAVLDSTSAAQMLELGVLDNREPFTDDELVALFAAGNRRAYAEVEDCWPEEANLWGARAVAAAAHIATVYAAAAVVPEGPARDAVLALLETTATATETTGVRN